MAVDIVASETVVIGSPRGGRAIVSRFGGQVLSWKTADGREQLYLSPHTDVDALKGFRGTPIRGGIPICFPQFANRGPLCKHGWVRTSQWTLVGPIVSENDCARAVFEWVNSAEESHGLASSCALRLRLCVEVFSNALQVELVVVNTGSRAFAFTGALHTYLRCEDARHLHLNGLQGVCYEDGLRPGALQADGESSVTITGECERIYQGTANHSLCLLDGLNPRKIVEISQAGFNDTVIWNPGYEKAASFSDMPSLDWTKMLCVEAAEVQRPAVVEAGASWKGRQTLVVKDAKD